MYYETPHGLLTGGEQVLTLLIHGAGGSSQHWQPLLPYLLDKLCPILIDLPGHGLSGGTVPSSIDEAAILLDHFLTRLDVEQPIYCIGHSLGGMIAQRFAMLFPERVAKLALITTSARIQIHADFLEAALTGKWDLDAFRLSFSPDIPKEIQNLVLNEYPKMRVASDSSDFMDLSNLDLRAKISTLTIPTLIISGDDDVIISPRHSRFLHKEIPYSTLVVVPHGGHYVQVEQPERVAEALNRFSYVSEFDTFP
ncbi:MAG TPA: alpha/beta hydrolase [Ktedonobacteraceae bacterium]|nr:alpha/beta hydrolase [Ktedonobacteraceae bacterium]